MNDDLSKGYVYVGIVESEKGLGELVAQFGSFVPGKFDQKHTLTIPIKDGNTAPALDRLAIRLVTENNWGDYYPLSENKTRPLKPQERMYLDAKRHETA